MEDFAPEVGSFGEVGFEGEEFSFVVLTDSIQDVDAFFAVAVCSSSGDENDVTKDGFVVGFSGRVLLGGSELMEE